MKLRLEGNQVCFRISRKELVNLIKDKSINSSTINIIYSVKISEANEATLEYKNNNFTFTLPFQRVQKHLASLPSKHGIVEKIELDNGSILKVSLEVDVRDYKRSRVSPATA